MKMGNREFEINFISWRFIIKSIFNFFFFNQLINFFLAKKTEEELVKYITSSLSELRCNNPIIGTYRIRHCFSFSFQTFFFFDHKNYQTINLFITSINFFFSFVPKILKFLMNFSTSNQFVRKIEANKFY